MTVQSVKLSERTIKIAQLNPTIRELTDPRYPLRLRFHKSRERASWFIVNYSKGNVVWHKLTTWPLMSCSDVIKSLPTLLQNLSISDTGTLNSWQTVGKLLTWYCSRAMSDNSLKPTRRGDIKGSVAKLTT